MLENSSGTEQALDLQSEVRLKDEAIARSWLIENDAHPDSADILARELLNRRLLWIEGGQVKGSCGPTIFKSAHPRFFKQPEPEPQAVEATEPAPEPVAAPEPEHPRKSFAEAYPHLVNQKTGLPRDASLALSYARHGTIAPGDHRNPSWLDKMRQRSGRQ